MFLWYLRRTFSHNALTSFSVNVPPDLRRSICSSTSTDVRAMVLSYCLPIPLVGTGGSDGSKKTMREPPSSGQARERGQEPRASSNNTTSFLHTPKHITTEPYRRTKANLPNERRTETARDFRELRVAEFAHSLESRFIRFALAF